MNAKNKRAPAWIISADRSATLAHTHHLQSGVGQVLIVDCASGRGSRGRVSRRSLMLHHAHRESIRSGLNARSFAEPLGAVRLGTLHSTSFARHLGIVRQETATGQNSARNQNSQKPHFALVSFEGATIPRPLNFLQIGA